MVQLNSLLTLLATTTSLVQAHPGQSHESKLAELRQRNEYISQLENKDLAHCEGKLSKRGELSATVERRRETLKALRRDRGFSEDGDLLKHKKKGLEIDEPRSPP